MLTRHWPSVRCLIRSITRGDQLVLADRIREDLLSHVLSPLAGSRSIVRDRRGSSRDDRSDAERELAEASAGIEPAMRVLQTLRPILRRQVETPRKIEKVALPG